MTSLKDSIHKLEEILRLHKRGIELSGEKFNDNTFWQNLTFSIRSNFNKTNKEICKTRKDILHLVMDIREVLKNKIKYTAFDEKDWQDSNKSFKIIQEFSLDYLRKVMEIQHTINLQT